MSIPVAGRVRATSFLIAVGIATSILTPLPRAFAASRAGGPCSKIGTTTKSPTGIGLVCSSKKKWQPNTLPPVAEPATPPPALPVAPTRNTTTGCVTSPSTTVDYFPDKAKIVEAKGLSITYAKTFKVVKVTNPWRGAKSGFTYVLAQCGTSAPDLTGDLAGATVIQVPITSAAIMSTTLAPQFDVLGAADRIIAVDTPAYYSTPAVVKRIEAGAVKGTGGGSKANVELLVSLKPTVVITYGTGSGSFDGIDKLVSVGLPTLVEAGYMEETPLGRAEWVKLIGALTNRESEAEAEFSRWTNDYRALAAKVAQTKSRPTVISGSMFQGTWYMPGGKSFAAQYIRDAGGSFPWATDSSTGSLPLDFEAVIDKAYDATFWINAGFEWKTLRDTVAEDTRYAKLLAFKTGAVYGNDKRVNPTGGSDYFETAVVRPDLVLADLVAILHPELLPNHQTLWYRRIGSK